MRYSLLNRFRGAFLGAALGEILGVNCQNCSNQQLKISGLEIDRWADKRIDSTTVIVSLGKFAVRHAEELLGESSDRLFQPETFLQQNLSTQLNLPTQSIETTQQIGDRLAIFSEKDDSLTENSAQSFVQAPSQDLGAQLMTILPLILFQHDNLDLLQASIESLMTIAPSPSLKQFAHTLTLALQNQLLPHQLHSQLDCTFSPSASANSFTLALDAFRQTPHDFRLTLLQAVRYSLQTQASQTRITQTQEICAIAGAISGAYNSITGIPLTWRKALKQHSPETSPLLTLWDLTTEDELLALSDRLLAAWSGIHDALSGGIVGSLPVTAAPAVMRSHSVVKTGKSSGTIV